MCMGIAFHFFMWLTYDIGLASPTHFKYWISSPTQIRFHKSNRQIFVMGPYLNMMGPEGLGIVLKLSWSKYLSSSQGIHIPCVTNITARNTLRSPILIQIKLRCYFPQVLLQTISIHPMVPFDLVFQFFFWAGLITESSIQLFKLSLKV